MKRLRYSLKYHSERKCVQNSVLLLIRRTLSHYHAHTHSHEPFAAVFPGVAVFHICSPFLSRTSHSLGDVFELSRQKTISPACKLRAFVQTFSSSSPPAPPPHLISFSQLEHVGGLLRHNPGVCLSPPDGSSSERWSGGDEGRADQ